MIALVEKSYLLLPLLAALLYSLGAMGLKAASARGLELPRITFIANWTTAIAFFLVFIRPGQGLIPSPWWPPVLLAGVFFIGQIATFVALSRGDVSLATPVMGTKVVMVAFLLSLAGVAITWQTWAGALIALAGIACLQATTRGAHWGHVTLTLFAALTAAGAYAAFDTTVQIWSKVPGVGYARMVPAAMLIAAVLSSALLPLCGRGWGSVSRAAWGYLAWGVLLNLAQSMILITAIGYFGDAAGCNIVYGSRGIWSILVVWWLGHHFDNRELHVAGPILTARLIGAALLMAAIVLAFA